MRKMRQHAKYSMGNQKLEYCDTERDLGVIMPTDLKVESQCNDRSLSEGKQDVGFNKEDICCEDT